MSPCASVVLVVHSRATDGELSETLGGTDGELSETLGGTLSGSLSPHLRYLFSTITITTTPTTTSNSAPPSTGPIAIFHAINHNYYNILKINLCIVVIIVKVTSK